MKKIFLLFTLIVSLFLVSCSGNSATTSLTYSPTVISAEVGKSMMDNNPDIVLVDVRTLSEYTTYHIPNAILLPVDNVSVDASTVLPDKSKIYIIYCNSGNRSATASSILSLMGYPFVYDMGGIIDWPYETVTGE
ncbi:MAG: rhodanese-like domain-containing protein [Candidatus Izemoplasmatales bacterium]